MNEKKKKEINKTKQKINNWKKGRKTNEKNGGSLWKLVQKKKERKKESKK